jgi:hypothetical protein
MALGSTVFHVLLSADVDDRDVVVESENVPVEEEVVLDQEMILQLDSAILDAFKNGTFDPLINLLSTDSSLIDYMVIIESYH